MLHGELTRAWYSISDLLQACLFRRAEGLWLHVGQPPVIVLRGDHHHPLEEPPLTPEEVTRLFQSISDTRQRRELAERGAAQFIYRFRGVMDVSVCAKVEDERVGIEIHRPVQEQK
jgi:Tfp pilus assembly ATPase PilU